MNKDELLAALASASIAHDDPIYVKGADGALYNIVGVGHDGGYVQIDHGDSPRAPAGILNIVLI